MHYAYGDHKKGATTSMTHEEHKREVRIFIDNKEHRSPTPTTGHALYELGHIDSKTYDLYREAHKGDDELIPDDHTHVELKEDERFFSLKKKLNPGA